MFAVFQDGAIRGLNVAQMIRSLTSSTLSGWQEGKEQATDLTQLSASFRIDKGQATTTDLNLVGPLVQDDRRRHHRPRHQAARRSGSSRNW